MSENKKELMNLNGSTIIQTAMRRLREESRNRSRPRLPLNEDMTDKDYEILEDFVREYKKAYPEKFQQNQPK